MFPDVWVQNSAQFHYYRLYCVDHIVFIARFFMLIYLKWFESDVEIDDGQVLVGLEEELSNILRVEICGKIAGHSGHALDYEADSLLRWVVQLHLHNQQF